MPAPHDQSAGGLPIRGAVLREIGAARPYASSRPIRIEELELDAPREHELRIRLEAASICHSDLSVVNGSRARPVPMLLGHEAAGIVEAIGSDVDDVSIGQRVIATFLPRCGECENCRTAGRLPCATGSRANGVGELMDGGRRLHGDAEDIAHHLGVSGFATHAVVDRRSVVPVDPDVPAEVAALMGCAVLTGGGALLNDGRITPETDVAIVGLGGVGMAGLLTAAAIGCRSIVAIDTKPEKLALALELGATAAVTPDQALETGARAGVVLEAVGHPSAFETAIGVVRAGGTVITVGLPAPQATARIEPLRVTAEALTIVGSYMGSAVPERDIPTFVNLWRQGNFPVERLVSARIGLDHINEAMDALAEADALRQVIEFA